MRFVKYAMALCAVVTALVVSMPLPVEAGGSWRDRGPSGWGVTREVRHRVYRPRYRHVYEYHRHTDPYAYRYEPRGYYPYYNSGYWRPAHVVRKRRYLRKPPYYKSWGDNRRGYHHRRWHRRNHGRIRRGHW
ncbi:MAG: hypothetical protein K0U74_08050 [Alphaproteobacteria bacterium]|nr:hypothetical protein [Alphaproteobacteria bacterium]